MRLPTQSHLLPDELWLAARVVERRAIGTDDNAEANAVAVEYLLNPDVLEHQIAVGQVDVTDPLVDQAVALIRRYTAPVDGDPLLRPLPAITGGGFTVTPTIEGEAQP